MAQTGTVELLDHQVNVLTESDFVAAMCGWIRGLEPCPPGADHVHVLRVIRKLHMGLDTHSVTALRDTLEQSQHLAFEAAGVNLSRHLETRHLQAGFDAGIVREPEPMQVAHVS